jgi:predicted ATP-dependent serine protease
MIYTIHQINPTTIKIKSVEDATEETITQEHNRYEALSRYLNDGKLLSISDRGTWSGRKDYEGYYKETPEAKKDFKLKLTQLDDLNFSDDLFVPLRTGTVADQFLSNDGGFLPGTNIMAAGAPGVGKTTVLLELLYNIRKEDPTKKVLFISAEMNQLDMARYLKRFPHWGTLPILFLSDYADGDSKRAIEETLKQGWDIVLTDSYTEVNDTVKEESGMSRGKTEKWFLDLMTEHNMANNVDKHYTTFVTILQLSKGGTFVGSNKLKHMTTAMLHLDWKGTENSSERFMEFSKNRTGEVGKKMFFNFDNGVQFDELRYKRDLLNEEMVKEEREKLKSEEDAFDKLFASLPTETETTEAASAE